jgi:hypothetical protein
MKKNDIDNLIIGEMLLVVAVAGLVQAKSTYQPYVSTNAIATEESCHRLVLAVQQV